MKRMTKKAALLSVLTALCILFYGCAGTVQETAQPAADSTAVSREDTAADSVADIAGEQKDSSAAAGQEEISLDTLPEFSGEPYVELHNNKPEFSEDDFTEESYESYEELDALGRCVQAVANIGSDLMPTEERDSIGQIKPSGWHTVKYDSVDGKYLYNRCHMIGYQLTAENANEKNLITGTRYMNVEGMLPFEDMVADYIRETDNHVLYRVTPVFEGNNLVASGVQMEAQSVEDSGEGICYNVYVYNVQPGIEIDYATGESRESSESLSDGTAETSGENTYVLNKNSKKFHYPDCSGAADIKEDNREEFTGSRDDVISMGYEPCGRCKP